MNICITSFGNDLNAEVDPKFGRCVNFIIVNADNMEFEVIENTNAQTKGGAGIQAGQFMSEKNVKAVLTGNVGPNAHITLEAAEIDIFTGVSGKVKNAIQKFNNNEYKKTNKPSVESHHGM